MSKPKMSPRQKSELRWGWAFMFPTVLGLLVLNIPLFMADYTDRLIGLALEKKGL